MLDSSAWFSGLSLAGINLFFHTSNSNVDLSMYCFLSLRHRDDHIILKCPQILLYKVSEALRIHSVRTISSAFVLCSDALVYLSRLSAEASS